MRIPTCFLVLALALPACGHAVSPDEAADAIHDPNPRVRQRAADAMRAGGAVASGSLPILFQALAAEQDPAVRGAIYITLGTSGAAEAKPVIDQAVMTAADANQRRWASRALKAWMVQTGALPDRAELPPGWPYGQPGYPPILAR